MEPYMDYCRKERVRTSKSSFWDLLNSGYSLALGTMFREELQRRADTERRDLCRKTSLDSLKLGELDEIVKSRLPEEETINTLKGLIGICILSNSKAIIGGRELSGKAGLELLDYMEELTQNCFEWELLWRLVEHIQMELKTQEIKRYFWGNSAENENLTEWVALQTHSERYSVAECYDHMWNELINAAIWRKENSTKDQHFKLLDWMRKNEEN